MNRKQRSKHRRYILMVLKDRMLRPTHIVTTVQMGCSKSYFSSTITGTTFFKVIVNSLNNSLEEKKKVLGGAGRDSEK